MPNIVLLTFRLYANTCCKVTTRCEDVKPRRVARSEGRNDTSFKQLGDYVIMGRRLHLVSGAGSAPIPPIKLRARTVFPEEIRLERIGFAVLELSAERIRVRFYDGAGRARTAWIVAAK